MKRSKPMVIVVSLIAFSLVTIFGLGGRHSSTAAESKISIVYWTFLRYGGDGPREIAETHIIEAFKKKHPNIRVDVENVPWFELHKKFLATTAARGGPDVIRVDPIHLLAHVKADSLEPLDGYTATWSEDEKNDFFLWNATVVNGRKMSINIAQNAFTLLYRTDLFEEKGLKPPRTWEDFVRVCKALTSGQRWGFAFPLSRTAPYFQIAFAPLVWAAGGEVVDRNGKAVFNGKEGTQALEFLRDLVQTHKCAPPEATSFALDDVMQGFMAGKYAMVIEGANRYETIQRSDLVRGKVQVAYLPSPTGTKPSPAYSTGGWNLAINRNSRNKDAAWLFIQHYVSRESQAVNARVAGDFPARKSIFKEPFMQTPQTAHLRAYRDVLVTASRGPILTDRFEELIDALVVAAHKVLTGQSGAQEALNEAAKRFNEGLR